MDLNMMNPNEKHLESYFNYLEQVDPVFYILVLERGNGTSIFMENCEDYSQVRVFKKKTDLSKYGKHICKKSGYNKDIINQYEVTLSTLFEIIPKLHSRFQVQNNTEKRIKVVSCLVDDGALGELGVLWDSSGN